MIIECPYCATRFRLDVGTLGDRRPSLRCSHCSRTFNLPPIGDPEDDLTYEDDFDVDEENDETTAPPSRPAQTQLTFAPRSRSDEPEQPSLFGGSDDEIFDNDEEDYSIDFAPPRRLDEDDPEDDYQDDDDDDDFEEEVGQTLPVKSLMFFLGLVVAGYGLLAWTLRTEPDWARNLLKQVPVVGSEISATRLGREIVLENLHGRYERTKEGKLVFLVTGNARNQHDEPVRDIRIELELRDADGAVVAKQSTTCGSAMRTDLVRDLTSEQVQILRGWGTRPPEEATVDPGDSCPIVGIFVDVPDTVTQFAGQVVQARKLS
jgi:predicted Zn finger-like uncharacterized protein